jgi:hypothetical protein
MFGHEFSFDEAADAAMWSAALGPITLTLGGVRVPGAEAVGKAFEKLPPGTRKGAVERATMQFSADPELTGLTKLQAAQQLARHGSPELTEFARKADVDLGDVKIVWDYNLPEGVGGRTTIPDGQWTIRINPHRVEGLDTIKLEGRLDRLTLEERGELVNTIVHELKHAHDIRAATLTPKTWDTNRDELEAAADAAGEDAQRRYLMKRVFKELD